MARILSKLILLLFLTSNSLLSQSIFKIPLTTQTFNQWDEYIKKYAPSDSALRVVEEIANRHYQNGRAIVSMEVFKRYMPYFPKKKKYFENKINNYEKIMLIQTVQPGFETVWENYIKEKAPSHNAFIALQRLTAKFIRNRDWDSAIAIYKKFKPYFQNDTIRINKVIEILSAPEQNLIIRNLGPKINTEKNEWDPNPTPDGKYLFFSTSDRPDGYGGHDIYYSEMNEGKWEKAQNLGSHINSFNDETIDNISADGTTLLLSGTFTGTFGNFDIFTAQLTEDGWGSLTHLPMPINTRYFDEGANLTSDGKAILFTSDRPGGIGKFIPYGTIENGSSMGNMDIYIAFLTDSGWSQPINLGPTINTPYSERSPYLHPDGKTLYFSSNGHPGLGELDVFKSVRLRDDSWTEWSEPVNLGKEINTELNDWGYKISPLGDSAFFAGYNRVDGYGGWDIYSVSLPKAVKPEEIVIIKGKVLEPQGKPLSAEIKWEDLSTGKNIGTLKTNPKDGSYIIMLQPGKNYGYYAEKKGYYPNSNNIDLRKEISEKEIIQDIILQPILTVKEQKIRVILNNIFFDYNDYTLKPESYPELNRLAKLLEENPDLTINIYGHTDSIGSYYFNKTLGQNRADAVKNYLIGKGIEPNRMKTFSMSYKEPIADNTTEEGRARNRRVEIWFEKYQK